MLPQAVPMAPVMNMVMRRMRLARLLRAEKGVARNFWYCGRAKRPKMRVKNFASAGKAVR